ncbi:MAG TPA: DUF177 domain-containing protein [Terriglobales bacterium]|jgi:uncharacterized protein|nr:DUF177 domain-containing protein [Terriglobales bacterium]
MFIRVRDLEAEALSFDREFRPGTIDLGAEMRALGPLRVTGRADLIEERTHGVKETIKDIRVTGHFSGTVQIQCARCLENMTRDLAAEFDLLYRPLAAVERDDQLAISEADTEVGFYKGEGLQLEDVLREQLLLAVPVKAVCREECRGLCPQCGQNLNEGKCACGPAPSDPRWNALRELRGK